MTGIADSFNTYLNHTGRYYSRLLAPRGVRLLIPAVALVVILTSIVVAHAGIVKWMVEDVVNEEILKADYDFVYKDDAPVLSDNLFHLQMPMMLEEYLDAGHYVSDGSAAPENERLDDALKMTVESGFFDAGDFELAPADEWEDAAEDAAEFVFGRPPQSGLK